RLLAMTHVLSAGSSPMRQALPSQSDDPIWRPHWLARAGMRGWVAANLATASIYIALGYAVAQFFAAYGLFPAPIWLPSSIALVAAMVGGPRIWPALFV